MLKNKNVWSWLVAVTLWMALVNTTGCSLFPHKLSSSSKAETKITVANSTNAVYSNLYWLFIAGIVVVAGGVGATIIMPGDDHIPYGIIGGGLALTALSLFFIVTIPILKWLILGLVGIGTILVIRVAMVVWKDKKIEKLMRTTT